MRLRLGVLLALLALSLVALVHRSRVQAAVRGLDAPPLVGRAAPELPASTRTLDGQPLQLAALRGRVVLLHFWTFACSNCHHMLPAYGRWHARLAARGLSVIGVHTPELDEERDPRKLAAFVAREQIRWPVIHDLEMKIWDRYGVSAWPTIVLIDARGPSPLVRAVWVGDDHTDEIDAALARLL